MTAYAILDQNDVCINRIAWDGKSNWRPPINCRAILDDANFYKIYVEPTIEPEPELQPEISDEVIDGSKGFF